MAILYGTTSDGDSLPVEVNEFGQLVAQGLQGQEGPPGPPGVGQLPPDPFEGAILGWKDNTLAWLGGSVPLPEGTYGPILEYEDGVLTLETPVDLPYLTRINLTSENGSIIEFKWATSPIANVQDLDERIFLEQIQNFTNNPSPYNGYTLESQRIAYRSVLFDKFTNPEQWVTISQLLPDIKFPGYIYYSNSVGSGWELAQQITADGQKAVKTWLSDVFKGNLFGVGYQKADGGPDGTVVTTSLLSGALVNSLALSDSANISQFNVGDLVQSPDVTIVSADEDASVIVTTPGNWKGSDGSGSPDGDTRVFSPDVRGTGTVQSTTGNVIVLREDNTNWLPGDYVTVPEQEVAVRYVYADEIKKKLL